MRRIAILACLLVAACAQSPEPRLTYAEAPPGEAPPPASLAGDWQVILLDGERQHNEGVAAQASDAQVWLVPRCAGMIQKYRIVDNRVTMTPVAPGAVCKIGMPPLARETSDALALADTVESAPAGAIRLHGGGLVLLLVPRETE